MGQILPEVRNRLKDLIDEYHAEIREPKSWPTVMGYAPWIEEVWANYISNGIKYGGKPPVIELGAEHLGKGLIRFLVHDNGNGLPKESLDNLFNEFTRYSDLSIEGSGLGLSIVRRIIEKLGGAVDARSDNKPGNGCIFSFILPEKMI